MAQVKLKAPRDVTAVSHDGEQFEVENGHVLVSEKAAHHLRRSHGFILPGVDREPPEDNDEPVTEEDLETDEVHFADNMTKKELIAYLRGEEVDIPRGLTVGELREMVKEHHASKSEEQGEE